MTHTRSSTSENARHFLDLRVSVACIGDVMAHMEVSR